MMQVTDFEKIRELTSNGRKFGNTYLVEHKETKAKGVLKLIQKNQVSEVVLQQLKTEASLSFQEKGLPEIWCQFENENYFSLIKKYQEGILWEDYLERLSTKEFYRHLPLAVVQLIEILHVVHKRGWIHGDIKPSNILIHASAIDDFQIELIDFGMSRQIGKTLSTELPFSLGFSSAERMLNRGDLLNEKSDFYSLGISLIYLFTGSIPLQHPNPELFTNLQLTHPIDKPNRIPKSVWEIISRMVEKPNFPKPPHHLNDEKVVSIIQQAQSKQLEYSALLEKWRTIEIKKTWLGYR